MKYLKFFEKTVSTRERWDYVKVSEWCDEYEEFGDNFYQIISMDWNTYKIIDVFTGVEGRISNLHVRDLTPQEKEELLLKLKAKKYNL